MTPSPKGNSVEEDQSGAVQCSVEKKVSLSEVLVNFVMP